MPSTTPRLAVSLLSVLLALLGVSPASGAAPAADAQAAREALRTTIADLARRDSAGDAQYYAAGRWRSRTNVCWWCQVGPGTGAAVLWRDTRDPRMRRLAIQTFDRAIRVHRNRDGSFGARSNSPDVRTAFFGLELGTAYRELGPATLGPARAARWRAALAGAGRFLIRNGNVTWYTNGNVNLANTGTLWLAWRATGDPRLRDAYERSWRFTLAPPQDRWKGFGLRTSDTSFQGFGTAGYLAESGGGDPGFDPEYAQLQLDIASRLWVQSRDPRALRLVQLLTAQLMPRVDERSELATDLGTRRAAEGRRVPFLSPGPAVLTWTTGRQDLAPASRRIMARTEREFRALQASGHPNMYRSVGNQLAVVVQAARG